MGATSNEKPQFDDGTSVRGWEGDYDIKNLRYCDKGGHKERSIKNEPNHIEFWQKQEP